VLTCRSFAHFLLQALGDVKNEASNACLDSMWHSRIGEAYGLYGCHGQGGSQAFALSKSTGYMMPLANLEVCLLPTLQLGRCSSQAVWTFTDGRHLKSDLTKECLAVSTAQGSTKLAMIACDAVDPNLHLKWVITIQQDHPEEHIAADKLDAAHEANVKSEFVESVKDRARAKAKKGSKAAKKVRTNSSKTSIKLKNPASKKVQKGEPLARRK